MNEVLNTFFKDLFDTGDFMPRWMCGKWSEVHGWVYILSNIAVFAAYFTIPFLLYYFISKRKDIPFKFVFIWFILFILFCGSTHLMDAIIFWFPFYRLNAVLLSITAIVSWVTVFILYRSFPEALTLTTPKQLQVIIQEQTQELILLNAKLSESEKRFKALVNNNPDVITRMGKDLTYQFVNDSFAKMSYVDPTEFIGKTPQQILPDHPHTTEFTEKLQSVISSGQAVHYEVHSFASRTGEGFFHIDMIPLLDSNDDVDGVLTITKDITDIRMNEKQLHSTIDDLDKLSKRLEYKRRTLQDFAYIISHNLRAPVGNLSAITSLYERVSDEETKHELITKISEVSDQLSSTVEDLSQVVNVVQNKEIELQLLNFEEILKAQMLGINHQIQDTGAQVVYDFSDCETIRYPKMYLDSIIYNLLTNAIKYSSDKRKPIIKFTSSVDDKGIISLSCEDNGMGIDMQRYGNKLFSLHKTFHNHPDARGVGLFITKNQIEALGGHIKAYSELDKGTRFVVTFNEIQY